MLNTVFSLHDTRVIIVYFWIISNHANNIRGRWFVAQLTSCDRYIVEERGRFETRRGAKIGVGRRDVVYRIERGRWRNEQRKEDSRRMTRARSNDDERNYSQHWHEHWKRKSLFYLFFFLKWKKKKKKKKKYWRYLDETTSKIILISFDIPDSFIHL